MRMIFAQGSCLLFVAVFAVVQARVLLSHDVSGDLWQPTDVDREDWLRCHGFPCEQWERTQQKVKRLKYMAQANGEMSKLNDGEVPPDDNPADDSLDGCIWLTEEQIDGITEQIVEEWKGQGDHAKREKRKLKDFSNYPYGLWDMPIVWKFDGNHNFQQREIIRGAFQHWEQNTCVRFQEIGVKENHAKGHLIITRENTGCHSFIGRITRNPQQINLQDACIFTFGTIVHEIGHSLGLWHEQQRSDRDAHIDIQEENLGYYAGQFVKQNTASLGVPYDVASVMHYDSYAGSKNGRRTIKTLDPWEQKSLGQRTGLSFLDAKIINRAYCDGACKDKLPFLCEHGGYQDPNDCTRCKCPDGFTGYLCEKLAPSNAHCGAEIRLNGDGTPITINTPGYSSDGTGSYHNNDECNWKVTAPSGFHVEMKFVGKFAVYCHYSSQCYHWAEVKYNRETLDEGNPGARFCCYSRPKAVITSEDQEMVVTLRANWTASYATSRRGFKAQFVAVRDQQSGVGVTQNPGTPSSTASTRAATTTLPPNTTPRPTEPKAIGNCNIMDLVFLLDSSGSVTETNWKKMLHFAQEMIGHLPIGENDVRVGLVSFGNNAEAHVRLNDHNDEMMLSTAIGKVSYKDQWTNTGEGLRVTREVFQQSLRNERKIIIMVTDGESNRDSGRTIPQAEQVRDAGIEIITLAVGQEANLEEAEQITGSAKNVLTFGDFDSMDSSRGVRRVLNHICEDDMMAKPNTGSAKQIWSCSFETQNEPLCGIDQARNDNFDWSQWSGTTPSQETGPSGAYDGSNYLYIEASKPRKNGDTAKLLLPRIPRSGRTCFRFHYNMNGHHVNSLTLSQLSPAGSLTTLWKRSGDNGEMWKAGRMEVDFREGDRLVLVGATGMEFSGDIAVDKLELFEGNCAE